MSSVEKKHFGTLLKRDGSEVEVSEYSLKNSKGMVVEVKRISILQSSQSAVSVLIN